MYIDGIGLPSRFIFIYFIVCNDLESCEIEAKNIFNSIIFNYFFVLY